MGYKNIVTTLCILTLFYKPSDTQSEPKRTGWLLPTPAQHTRFFVVPGQQLARTKISIRLGAVSEDALIENLIIEGCSDDDVTTSSCSRYSFAEIIHINNTINVEAKSDLNLHLGKVDLFL